MLPTSQYSHQISQDTRLEGAGFGPKLGATTHRKHCKILGRSALCCCRYISAPVWNWNNHVEHSQHHFKPLRFGRAFMFSVDAKSEMCSLGHEI